MQALRIAATGRALGEALGSGTPDFIDTGRPGCRRLSLQLRVQSEVLPRGMGPRVLLLDDAATDRDRPSRRAPVALTAFANPEDRDTVDLVARLRVAEDEPIEDAEDRIEARVRERLPLRGGRIESGAHGRPSRGGGAAQGVRVFPPSPDFRVGLPVGEILSVSLDPAVFNESARGDRLQCTACHRDIAGYPHPMRGIVRSRDIPLRYYTSCQQCHEEQYGQYLDSSHARALAGGDEQAAVCTDCHGAHNIQLANPDAVGLALGPAVYSCGKCHPSEFGQYKNSVHGKALLERLDPNVPACVDCHGVHLLSDPTVPGFRRESPYLCGSCHADEELMKEYGLSTHILETYVADFHGTTAQLFPSGEGTAPNTAVCYDCHGVHNIEHTHDPDSPVLRQNLVEVCRKCHPSATLNYPAAWLGHYEPTSTQAAPVYWTQVFFTLLTVTVMAGLIGHIAVDQTRTALDRVRGGSQADE